MTRPIDSAATRVQEGFHRFLVCRNYEGLLACNCVQSYALSVAFLAERICSR